jgi:hypothetical protein
MSDKLYMRSRTNGDTETGKGRNFIGLHMMVLIFKQFYSQSSISFGALEMMGIFEFFRRKTK